MLLLFLLLVAVVVVGSGGSSGSSSGSSSSSISSSGGGGGSSSSSSSSSSSITSSFILYADSEDQLDCNRILTAHTQFEYYRNGWRLEEFLLSATPRGFYILFCRVLIPSANTPAHRQISKIRISSKQQKSYLE